MIPLQMMQVSLIEVHWCWQVLVTRHCCTEVSNERFLFSLCFVSPCDRAVCKNPNLAAKVKMDDWVCKHLDQRGGENVSFWSHQLFTEHSSMKGNGEGGKFKKKKKSCVRVLLFFWALKKTIFPVSGNMPFSIFWLVSGRDVNSSFSGFSMVCHTLMLSC